MIQHIEHIIVFGGLELVCVDNDDVYIVDRELEVLRNIHQPELVLALKCREEGSFANGSREIIEHYVSDDGKVDVTLFANVRQLPDSAVLIV